LEPAAAERTGVAEARRGRALGEPGVLAQQGLETLHLPQIARQPRYRHACQMQAAARVVVQLEREIRRCPVCDLTLDPPFQREILRLVFRIRGAIQVSVEVTSAQVETRPAFR